MFDARHALHRRTSILVAVLLLAPLTLLSLRHPSPAGPLAWSLGLAVALLGAAVLSTRARFASVAYYLAAVASAVASVGIVMGTGGTSGPRFGFLLALPPIVLVVVPELPWASAFTGLVTVAGSILLIAREGRGGWFLVEWATVALLVIALSYRAAVGFRRLWYETLEREARYASALLRLAEAEKVRARSDRVNLLARLAARLSHELNNPLAAARSNVTSLVEGDSTHDGLGLRETLADTRASLDRISLVAAELRTLAAMVPGEPARCSVSGVLQDALARLDGSIRGRIRLTASPALEAVVDGTLLAHCVRHLVIGAASLDEPTNHGALCLDAAPHASGVRIELFPDRGADAHAAPSRRGPGGRAALHLAIAEELAQALGAGLESARLPDGAERLAVTLPPPIASA